jgi:DNA polymerase
MNDREDQTAKDAGEAASWAARQVKQRLESLKRAGLDRVPIHFKPPPPARGGSSQARGSDSAAAQSERSATAADVLRIQREPAAARSRPPAAAPVGGGIRPMSLFEQEEGLGPEVAPADRPAALAELKKLVDVCTKCPVLVAHRTQTVFGEGNPQARLMFIGEAPGADEDRTGRPFVGRAGQLLTDIIEKGMGLARSDVYIANVLKSRPPGNRDPEPDEVLNCMPFLERQLSIIRPQFLCLLGRIAAQALLGTSLPLGKLRGKWWRVKGIPAIVTYHPAYLLRNPASKKDTWDDIQLLMTAMGLKVPGKE